MREIKKYHTLDDIVESVSEKRAVTGVYACAIQEDVGLFRFLYASHWREKIVLILTLVLFVGAAFVGVSDIIVLLFLASGSVLYLYMKGKRIRPSLLIATDEKLYLISEILYDINTEMCDYDHINIAEKDKVNKYFRLAGLNPMYHLFSFHRKLNGRKYIISKSPIIYLIFKKFYPKKNLVSFAKIKELFSPYQ